MVTSFASTTDWHGHRRTLDLLLGRHQALVRLGGVQQVVAELGRQLAAFLLDLIEALLGLALPQVGG